MGRYRTPLRYPGGKQRLAPFIAEVMEVNGLPGGHYVEPYAGGAGVACELLIKGIAGHIHLNDASRAVYCFWRSILSRTDEFCRRIMTASLTVDEWRRQREILRNSRRFNSLDVGFSLFYLNRCNRSGIPTGGLIGGLAQKGRWLMDARFPRNELIHRIEAVAAKRARITVHNMDAEDYLTEYVGRLPANSLVYCDPPYFHKASRLYLNHYQPADHARVARLIQRKLTRRWLVSYDAVPEIFPHYSGRRSFTYDLQYNAAAVREGREVFFCSDRLKLPERSKLRCIDDGLRSIAG